MLFSSKVDSTMEILFKQAQHQANTARKQQAIKRNDLYQSEQDEYIVENLSKWSSNPEKLTPLQVNIVKKIVNLTSATYIQPAKRSIDGTEADQAIYGDICKAAMIDSVMKQASRYCKLHKTILLRVVWRGQVEIDVLTPDLVDVTVGDSPRDLKQVMVTNWPESGRAEDVTYSVWTPETFQRLDWRGTVIEFMPNPYGVLPFVPCWDSLPLDSFWVKGGQDLVSAQGAINEKLTDLLYIIRSQGYGVGWMKSNLHGPGDVTYNSVTVDPGGFVLLPNDDVSGIGYVSPQAPIGEVWEVIQSLIQQVGIANGLSAHSLTAKVSEESGLSKIVSNQELMEKRQDDIELWRRYEGQLFELTRTVWNAHNPGRKISDKAQFRIDFADLRDPSQEVEDASKWQLLIDAGQASPIDWAISRNPDLDREQAKEYLIQVQQESAELGANREKSASFDFD